MLNAAALMKLPIRFFGTVKYRNLEAPSVAPDDIHYRDIDSLNKKIQRMKNKPLTIFSDFDNTLTRNFIGNSVPSVNSIGVICFSNYLPQSAQQQINVLTEKYVPIFKDKEMPRDSKHTILLSWWKGIQSVILQGHFTREKIRESILSSTFYFRYGIFDLLQVIDKYNLNFIISSAGVLGSIEESLELLEKTKPFKKPNIFGTSEEYDDKGVLISFKEPIITSFNKSSMITHESCDYIKKGTNGIVIGDIVPDLYVTEKLDLDTIISIGYYGLEEDVSLEEFIKEFDITIKNDGDLTCAVDLINRIQP